ncbi:MAG: N-acetylmuramoyl-L-alanine amidase [Oscillospiraceae bacterium]
MDDKKNGGQTPPQKGPALSPQQQQQRLYRAGQGRQEQGYSSAGNSAPRSPRPAGQGQQYSAPAQGEARRAQGNRPESKMPPPRKKKKKRGGIIALVLILALVLGGGAGLTYLMWGDEILPALTGAPQPYIVDGQQVKALRLDPIEQSTDKDALKAYYQSAVEYAVAGGYNTIVYTGKSDLSVFWKDSNFPMDSRVTIDDNLFNHADPLALLCSAADGKGVQIWLAINPLSAGGYSSDMSGKVADIVKNSGGASATTLDITNEEYTKLLTQSLSRIPRRYPVAAILLEGLDGATSSDAATWEPALVNLVGDVSAEWQKNEYATTLALGFADDDTALVTPALAQTLAGQGLVKYIMPQIQAEAGLAAKLDSWRNIGASLIVTAEVENPAQVLFTAASKQYGGTLLADYAKAKQDEGAVALLATTLDQVPDVLPLGFEIPQTLNVTYPVEGQKVSSANIYIMGTSDPEQELLMNGTPVERTGTEGTFGVVVPVVTGSNVYTFTNGAETHTLTFTKPEPSGGSTTTPVVKDDGTKEAQPGQAVRVKGIIASALTDYTNVGAINETLVQGGVAVVTESIQFKSNSTTRTWAYKLASGDYVRATAVEWVSGDGKSVFTGLSATETDGGETVVFEGSGTPVVYNKYDTTTEHSLKLTMYDTTFTLPEGGFSSKYVKSVSVQQIEGGVELTLNLNPVWGYQISYENGTTQVFFKRVPVQSTTPGKPLEGITVMVSAGHGGDDIGTPGLLWNDGPNEKHINLVLAQAIAHRLEQMGAEVIMTRTDDSTVDSMSIFPSMAEQKPDFVLWVHHNAAEPDQDLNSVMGSTAYYYAPSGLPVSATFAQNLLDEVGQATGRDISRGIKWSYYNLTRTNICPSVLFEYGFVYSPTEFEDITSTDGIYAAALASADALLKTVPTTDGWIA